MRKALRISLRILLVLVVIIAGFAGYVYFVLPSTGKAQSITIEGTPQRLERGAYLVNHVTACLDCHSRRDYDYFAGPIDPSTLGAGGEKFGREIGFPGNVYTTNITPHNLKNWTDGEVYRAITEGVHKNGKALFPIMPYGRFSKMSQEDLYSIIAYIRTLPSIPSTLPARELDFPLNFIVNTVPAKATPAAQPDTANSNAYGGYLVNAASCIQCHSREDKGDLVKGSEYGGGQEFKMEHGTSVLSANISPDAATGIGSWSKEAFIQRFKIYSDSAQHLPKLAPGSKNTPMPWLVYSGMSTKDLGAIYDYLRTVTPVNNRVPRD